MKNYLKPHKLTLLAATSILLLGCNDKEPEIEFSEPLPEVVDFNFDVRPILSDTCFLCHGPDLPNAKNGLSFASFDLATSHVTDNGIQALIPGNAEGSEAFMRIMSTDESYIMPPLSSNLVLTPRQKAIIKKWIDQGAEYKKHWAYITPAKAKTPTTKHDEWASNPIDNFIAKKIADKGLSPNKKAEKETLIRRVTFDLTGLPPTLEEIDDFLQDTNENAYEKLIARLMASPSFGERLSVEWLDVARYADTHGYSTDYYRDMSPYRDWVIKSFNENRPFDEFVTWQIAGDLMPNASQEQILATAFNRVHAQNGEGGIVNEEFRVEYVKDRVQAVGTGLLGLTMHCAQCHDHKYDPISAKDYYSTFAFFNNIDESGQISYDPTDIPVPTLLMPTNQQAQNLANVTNEISDLSHQLETEYNAQNQRFNAWLTANTQAIKQAKGKDALIAHFPLTKRDNNKAIANKVSPKAIGKVIFGSNPKKKEGPAMVHVSENGREAIKLNGDDPLYFPSVNDFDRARPFSVSIDVKLPNELEEGVLVHYNKAGILYNFKGFDIGIQNNRWLVRLAHTYPFNAIALTSPENAQRDQWLNVTMTYDGSSKAEGVNFYINGEAISMNVDKDNLFKDIKHTHKGVLKEIGIKVGARWRSRGTKDALVDDLKIYNRDLTRIEIANINNVNSPSVINNKDELLTLFNKSFNPDYKKTASKLISLRQKQNSMAEQVQEIMVMKEMPEPRQAYILERGSYASHGEAVSPGVPETILPYDDSLPKNRLGLAAWLTDPKHPLVSRVVINRYWQMLFGTGIVRTPEDFGNQGQLPTHPQLLDWLAREFVDSGWDIKHMLTLMVTSSAYQQSSIASQQLMEADPENKLYARGPTNRLTAEMIRDNALAASGLLVDSIGGESVYPYQPDGIWKMNSRTPYKHGSGDDLYRKSMYTIYKRSVPPPNMTAFDAPMRSYTVGERQQTSTPLQALSLLNDPQIIEASRVLASKAMSHSSSLDEQLKWVYRKLTSNQATAQELDIIMSMYNDINQTFAANPEQADEFLAVGDKPLKASDNKIQLASLGSITNMLMNHDAVVIKR